MSTGKSEINAATLTIKPAGNRINQISKVETIGAKGETNAAINPTIVMGATTGAARMLAIMLIGDR